MIEAKKTTSLETKLQVTNEREADFILRVDPVKGEQYILHIEFQSTNDSNMLFRMLRYYIYITETYKKTVRQYVIYIGRSPLSMSKGMKSHNLSFSYEIIDMKDVPCESFLQSDNPEEIILAILCDFTNKDERLVINRILEKLKDRVKNETRFSKYIRQLEILSQLRDLQKTVLEEENKMSIIYDLEKDPRYKQGIEKEKSDIVRAMLQDGVDIQVISKYTGLSESEIEKLRNMSN